MQVKVFEAPDMATGLKMVKKSLGPDALILSTKTIRKGKMGLLAKPIMEITAAIDTPPPTSANVARTGGSGPPRDDLTYESIWKASPQPPPPRTYQREAKVDARPSALSDNDPVSISPQISDEIRTSVAAESLSSRATSQPAATDDRATGLSVADQEEAQKLKEEIKELKELVNGLNKKVAGIDKAAPNVQTEAVAPVPTEFGVPSFPFQHPVVTMLTARGVLPEAAADIARSLEQKLDTGNLAKRKYDEKSVQNYLSTLFEVRELLPTEKGKQKRAALIGPTGVGKTTTIAKLAAGYLNQYQGSIGLITIDTYRIAAVEQLKVYGEIMQLPVEVVIKPHELPQALDRLADRDLILIDTAGRSPRNETEINEMTTFLRPELNIENHLVLSATTRDQELLRTIERFNCLPLASFLYTKLDECEELGVFLNIRHANDTPLSYLTNGQRVPEDIMRAEPETVAGLIMDANLATKGAGSEQ